jgi:hypothetical protein
MESSKGRTSSHSNKKNGMDTAIQQYSTLYAKTRVQKRGKPWTGIPRDSEGHANHEQPGKELLTKKQEDLGRGQKPGWKQSPFKVLHEHQAVGGGMFSCMCQLFHP